jgi:hypothetical protein
MVMRTFTITKGVSDPMLYAGIDYHKRYSQVHVIDHGGRTRATARLANDGLTVGKFFQSLGEPCTAVLEAGWNWGVMYDWLAASPVEQVELARPLLGAGNRRGPGQDRRHRGTHAGSAAALQLDPTCLHTGSRDPTPARNRPSAGIPGAGAQPG